MRVCVCVCVCVCVWAGGEVKRKQDEVCVSVTVISSAAQCSNKKNSGSGLEIASIRPEEGFKGQRMFVCIYIYIYLKESEYKGNQIHNRQRGILCLTY